MHFGREVTAGRKLSPLWVSDSENLVLRITSPLYPNGLNRSRGRTRRLAAQSTR
jgi:hypothetical protein